MNKKIKMIELLNMIENGEQVPKKIKYLNRIYKFYKGEKDYISYDDEETKWCGQTLLFNIMEHHYITELLEAEVEILEDNIEEIEELLIKLLEKVKNTPDDVIDKAIDSLHEKLRKEKE